MTINDAQLAGWVSRTKGDAELAVSVQNTITELTSVNSTLVNMVQERDAEITSLKAQVASGVADMAGATETIAFLESEVARLRAIIAAGTPTPPPVEPPPVEPPPPVPSGLKLMPPNGKLIIGCSAPNGAWASYQQITGTVPHVWHEYSTSSTGFATDLDAVPATTVPLLNFKPLGKMGNQAYIDILNGKADASIKAAAAKAKAYGKPMLVAPLHEPENDTTGLTGSALLAADQNYAKAFRYVVEMFRANGATNVEFVWNMMSFQAHLPRYDTLYPGDDVVDYIGADPYSHDTSDTLLTFGTLIEFYDAMDKHGKPMILCEWGIAKDVSASVAPRLTQAELDKLQERMPRLVGFIVWSQWLAEAQAVNDPSKDYRMGNNPTDWKRFATLPEFTWEWPAGVAK